MKHATERDWIAATRGNGTADREDFEEWALGLRGAPSRRDPRVWEYLITMAEEMESVERGAYGQQHDELAMDVAHGVVARFQSAYEPNARRRRPSSAPAFRSMLRPNRRPPPPAPSALRSARERDRARYGEDEEIPVRPFDPEERVPFGTKPHHFAYPNGGMRYQATRNPAPPPALPPMRRMLPPKR